MPYPELPWILKGEGPLIGGLFLSDIETLYSILPKEMTPISVLPGKTIGTFYYCRFGPGSEIEYNEFVIFPAFVKYKGKRGFFGQVMYVDNPDAVLGIFEKSGVPKRLASFSHVKGDGKVSVTADDQEICSISYHLRSFRFNPRKMELYGFGKSNKIKYLRSIWNGSAGFAKTRIAFSDNDVLDTRYMKKQIWGYCLDDFSAELFYSLVV